MTMQITLDQFEQSQFEQSQFEQSQSEQSQFERNPLTQNSLQQLDLDETLIAKGRLRNFISSVQAYADMSPDLAIRREVNSWMLRRDRMSLSLTQWSECFGGAHPVLTFVYKRFGEYSGLDFGRVRPDDSLNNHLRFPLICWFDWTITFCEDFFQAFDVDLSDRFDEADFDTIGELVEYLVQQVSPSS